MYVSMHVKDDGAIMIPLPVTGRKKECGEAREYLLMNWWFLIVQNG